MVRTKTAIVIAAIASIFAGSLHPAAAQMEIRGYPETTKYEPHESQGFTFHVRQVAGYNYQGGPRGTTSGSSENFQMMVYRGTFGPIKVEPHIRTSLEPWTFPKAGVPQLFQTGGTLEGEPVLDHKPPNDVWMEITEKIIYPFGSGKSEVFVQGGPVGSPALGPEPFMHRDSARHLPWTPLGHSYQDSTHVSMGILNAGVRVDIVEAELSQFNGRKPDENRKNIDDGKLDSWSTRVTLHLWDGFKAQASTGVLKSPEALELEDQRRTTASVQWKSGTRGGFQHATSFIYGAVQKIDNSQDESLTMDTPDEDTSSDPVRRSWLAESDITWGDGWSWFGRFESIEKNGLRLTETGDEKDSSIHRIKALTLGAFVAIDALSNNIFETGLGTDVTLHHADADVKKDYGSLPVGNHVFLMTSAMW